MATSANGDASRDDATKARRYDAFLSYSHAADGKLAPALQTALHRLAKPWYRRRALHVFRDKTSLSATPSLWPTIVDALAASAHFILLASPDAARSRWVQQEVRWWLQHRSPRTLLIVLTDGTLVWDDGVRDFDLLQTDAVPTPLMGAFDTEPLWVDLRWARGESHLSPKDPRFQDGVADLAAPLHGRPKEDLIGEDVRQYRRAMLLARAGVATLAILAVLLAGSTMFAWLQRNEATVQRDAAANEARVRATAQADAEMRRAEAERQQRIATSRELAMGATTQLSVNPELSVLLAAEGVSSYPSSQAKTALREAIGRSHLRATLHGHQAGVISAAFSADGTRIVTSGADRVARLWDASTGQTLSELPATTSRGFMAAFSPDGTRVVTAGDDGQAQLWDAIHGLPLTALGAPSDTVRHVGFSRDGTRFATVSLDGPARIWAAADGQLLRELDARTKLAATSEFSPDGARLVIAGSLTVIEAPANSGPGTPSPPARVRHVGIRSDGTSRIWDANSGRMLAELRGPAGAITNAAFSPDGRRVLLFGRYGNEARVWDAAGGQLLAELANNTGLVPGASFSSDGERVLTASSDGVARVWDAGSWKLLAELRGHAGPLTSAAFSPDGGRIVTASEDRTARVWDATDRQLLAELRGHAGTVTNAAFSPDGARVVTASDDRTVRIWDATGEPTVAVVRNGAHAVTSATFSPDGSRAVVINAGGTALMLETGRWQAVAQWQVHPKLAMSAAFSRDAGRVVVTTGEGAVAHVWDLVAGLMLARLGGGADGIRDAVISPDGTRVAASGWSYPTRVWDAGSGQPLAVFPDHGDSVTSVVFSSDGARIVTASVDGTARVWDAGSGRVIAVLSGHANAVRSAAFSPDGSRVITAGDDGTARIWDVVDGEVLAVLRGHTGPVGSARFSPDGALVLTAGADGTARVYKCDVCGSLDDLIVLVRTRVTRSLTDHERETYLHEARRP